MEAFDDTQIMTYYDTIDECLSKLSASVPGFSVTSRHNIADPTMRAVAIAGQRYMELHFELFHMEAAVDHCSELDQHLDALCNLGVPIEAFAILRPLLLPAFRQYQQTIQAKTDQLRDAWGPDLGVCH